MILGAFARAVAQFGDDPRLRKVLWLGLALTLLALFLAHAAVLWLVGWLAPASLDLPWMGEVRWVDDVASLGSLLLMLALSVVLMVPVASAITSVFLDDVAEAVEARHYPRMAGAGRLPFLEAVRDSLGFLGVLIAANLAALVLYLMLPFAAPLIFWAMNGYLLGREYYTLAAIRHLGRTGAAASRRRHRGTIWAAGVLMALPLSVPVVNLAIPILGAATFTHVFHRLEGRRPVG